MWEWDAWTEGEGRDYRELGGSGSLAIHEWPAGGRRGSPLPFNTAGRLGTCQIAAITSEGGRVWVG